MTERKSVPISIKLQTEIFQEGKKDEHYFDVEGQFVKVGNNLYLRYQEAVDPTDPKNIVSVTIKIEPDGSVHLIRDGVQRTRLRFNYQMENESNYPTPYGMMTIRTITNNLRVTLKDRPVSGNVLIDYELFGGEEQLGVYHLRLDFTA